MQYRKGPSNEIVVKSQVGEGSTFTFRIIRSININYEDLYSEKIAVRERKAS